MCVYCRQYVVWMLGVVVVVVVVVVGCGELVKVVCFLDLTES